MDIQHELEIIKRGIAELITEDELKDKLKRKKSLRIKLGLDPTAPDLHLGHTVVMQKLRQFQDLGHHVFFVIGDYTARVGDPSGQSVTRPALSEEIIEKNAKTYTDQAFKILDRAKTTVAFNSHWLAKMSIADFIKLGSKYTVARMMERDDFKKRLDEGSDVSILEFYYPLMQAYDSVVLKADVEIGGTDQKFNLLVGRTIQKRYDQEQQIVLTMPLLVGTDGVMKMSKSYGNYIGISEPPNDIFGKVMSISDDLMWTYYELLSQKGMEEIKTLKHDVKAGHAHPKAVKEALAFELVSRFHSKADAEKAKAHFDHVFAKRKLPDQIEEKTIDTNLSDISLVQALALAEFAPSKSEIKRVIQQGGLELDGEKITDIDAKISTTTEHDVKFGKRKFARIRFRNIS